MIIDEKSRKVVREKFESELEKDVAVKVFSRSIIIGGENPEFARFAESFVRELSEIDGRVKAEFYSLADKEAMELGLKVSPTLLVDISGGGAIEFSGAPVSYQAGVLIEAILIASRGRSGLSSLSRNKLENVDKKILLDVFTSAASANGAQPSLIACQIAAEIPKWAKVRITDVSQTDSRASRVGISSYPAVVANEDRNSFLAGFLSEDKIVNFVIKHASSKAAEILAAEEEDAKKREKLADNPDYPVVLTDENFDKAVEKYPFIVIDCWAEWCGPCRMVLPVIESLAKKRKGDIVFGRLNVDENQMIASRYGIMSIPTMLVFKNGEKVGSVVGAMPEAMLESKINAYR